MSETHAIHLPIAGLTAMTTLDFPGRLACVVFTQGCPLRCGYCHNPHMITPRQARSDEWQRIQAFLQSRQGLLEGVVFSGGEPMLHAGLSRAIKVVKSMGFAVGLHTAGPYPERLLALLPHLDWVGLDVKGRGRDFDRIVGRRGIWRRHAHSLEALLDSGIDFECRTTVHWRDFNLQEVERLALTLADCGVRHYALQVARHRQCLDSEYERPVRNAPPLWQLEQLIERLRPSFDRLTLRR